MGSPCLFTRQQALKLGYFYWLRVENSNSLLAESSLCYLKHTRFYLEHKASFIQISSVASINSFLIAWLWRYCTFSDSFVVSLRSLPWLKYTKYENIFPKKNHVLLSNLFSSSNMFFIRLFLANTWEKKSGVTVVVSSQTAVKGGHSFEIAVRMNNLLGGDWGEIQNNGHRVRSMHSRSSLFSVVFMCLISPTHKFKLEKSTLNTKE